MKIKRLGRVQWSIRLMSLATLLSGLLLSVLPAPIVRAASPHYVKSTATGTGDCSSWANACTLQIALTNAVSGDEIWVAAGTYTPTATTDRTATFQLKDGVAIYGGFAMTETLRSQRDWTVHVVNLSGDLLGDDGPNFANNAENSYHVVIGASGAILDGATVSGGNANGSYPANSGGGILNSSSSPTLTNVVFNGNLASDDGGGMLNFDNSHPMLTNVTFSGNSASYGGGMENWNNSNPTLTNVTFSGNSASYGGGMMNFTNGNPTLTNVTFSGNSAAQGGGGLANWFNSSPLLTNVTFGGNSALSGGALYDLDNSSIPQVRNSLLWGDSGGEINASSTLTITNSVVQGGCPAGGSCTNVITADPLLGLLGNYGGGILTLPLMPGSAAIDGTSADCPSTDQRRVARGATCDIGAFESQGFTLTKTSGDNQSAVTNMAFTTPLALSVTSAFAEPVNGGQVVLTAPSSGASITTTPITLTIAGGAVSQSVTANDTLGAYNVSASAEGATSVSFALTNTCGNTVTNANDSGAGSLRQAIADVCPDGIITFDDDYTIGLETGQLVIDKNMTIDGTGHSVIIDGQALSRVFYVAPDVTFSLVQATVTNGYIASGGPYYRSAANPTDSAMPDDVATDGGGLYLDGAFVTLQDVQIIGNYSGGSGGGIYNEGGVLSIDPTTIISNSAGVNGGGLYNVGGALIMTDTAFINNTANGSGYDGNGGGLYSVYGAVTLSRTQFLSNTAFSNGGGAYVALYGQGGPARPDRIAANPGTTVIDASLFQANIADGADGGGLYNAEGALIITDTIFGDNAAHGNWPNGNGGGLYSVFGEVVLNRTQFLTNAAYQNGGGAYLALFDQGGGGIGRPDRITAGTGTTEIDESVFQGNTTDQGDGAGLYSGVGTTTLITQSAFLDNSAICGGNCYGGGIYNAGTLDLDGLTLAANSVSGGEGPGLGGGLYNGFEATLTMSNSTVSGNRATNSIDGYGQGGGLALDSGATIVNTTVSGNTATDGGGIYYASSFALNNVTIAGNTGGGVYDATDGEVSFDAQNTIIGDNTDMGGDAWDCAGTLNSLGYNLIETIDDCTINGDMTGVLTEVDPQLGPLQNNGGPTWTMALGASSPALEAGNPATPGSGSFACAATDQRGVIRPQGATCDIGAYEGQVVFGKSVDVAVAQAGQRTTYTLLVYSMGTITNGVISDTLPAGLTLAGPITLEPAGTGTIGTPPTIVADLNLGSGQWLTITIPVTVNVDVANDTRILNTAFLTGDGLLPIEASATFVVDTFDLSSSVKLVNSATAIAGDGLTYTIQLTNTSLHKDSTFTLTDVIPSGAVYVPGSVTATLGSASYAGGVVTWMGDLGGTANVSDYEYGDSLGGGSLLGVAYDWIEISATGTPATFSDSDESHVYPIALPFAVSFYGTDHTNLAVSTNGAVYFEDGDLGYHNTLIPSNTLYGVNTYIAPLWTDLDVTPGTVYYEVQGTAPHRQVVIEFYQVSGYYSSGDHGTWEIILYEDRPDILFQYQDVNFGDSYYDYGSHATVGVQNSIDQGVEYSYNSPVLTDSLAIMFASLPASGFAADLTFAVTTTVPVPDGTWITNTAIVSNSYGDTWSLSAATLLSNPADLSIVKQAPSTVSGLAPLTYTLSITNNGPLAAAFVTVTDNLPAGVTFVGAGGAGWSCSQLGGAVTCAQPVLAIGAASDIVIDVTAPNISGTLINTAVITSTAYDEAQQNNTATATTTVILNTRSLFTATTGTGSGTIDLTPPGGVYLYGTVVTATATANVGSTLTGWSGACTGTGTCLVTIDDNKSITATFALNTYTLTVATIGNGTVTPTTSVYAYGAVVPITAMAGAGSTFTGWSGDLGGSVNPTSILIDGDKSITATFALNTYTLTVATIGNGTVTPTTSVYAYGAVVPITAMAGAGSTFTGWSGDLGGSVNPTSILIDGDKSITATFALNTYTLTVATIGNGTVTPTTSVYAYGTVVPVTATAGVGSSFTGWSGDLTGSINATSILIEGDKAITATFELNTYTLTVATVGNGSVTPMTSIYAYGTVVPVTATASAGSSFTAWSGNLSGSVNPTSILIDGDKSITATFALKTYTLTVATVGNGNVTPATSAYAYGTVVPVTATAGAGSTFTDWSGDLTGSVNSTSILIDGDKSITATFALNTYMLTVATVGNGTVSPTTSVYAYGTIVPVTATASAGSSFSAWSGDLSSNTNPTSILIDGDKAITATFALNTYTLTVATVGNGTVSPTTSVYPYGTVVPITATAGVGSSFTAWSGDLTGSVNPTSILIDGDKLITATFELNTYTLTVVTVGNGTVSPTTSAYAYGTVVPVTATAGVGSSFTGWSGDLTGSINPTSILIDGDKAITATFTVVIDHYSVFLPLIMKNYLRLPDLIVQSVTASSDVITVVIKNIGDGPAEQAFWVDAYINPTPPPTAVNQIWWDLDRSHEGVAWGVIDPIVPIQPGEVYTLTSHGAFVSPDRTFFPGHLPVGTPIYAQVDSYNAATNYGAVLETHEYYQRPYNNILGPVYTIMGSSGPLSRAQPIGPQLTPGLPERSARP